jgi:RimJ/RimL family protein N-acetyltransferase
MILNQPDPPLGDDLIRLEPMTSGDLRELHALAKDEAIRRYTRVPVDADEAWVARWIGWYETAWRDGSRAGFTIRDRDGRFLGFASFVELHLAEREGEIGYAVAPAARGNGVALRALRLLTRWGLDELQLQRIELQIDVSNAGSLRIAERAGYRQEGVRRSVHFKDGVRADMSVWSLLPGELPLP